MNSYSADALASLHDPAFLSLWFETAQRANPHEVWPMLQASSQYRQWGDRRGGWTGAIDTRPPWQHTWHRVWKRLNVSSWGRAWPGLAREWDHCPVPMTALMLATDRGQAKTVELLLPYSNPMEACPANGMTALMIAAKQGHLDGLRLLAAASRVDQQDHYGATALAYACQFSKHHKYAPCVQILLQAGANPNLKMTHPIGHALGALPGHGRPDWRGVEDENNEDFCWNTPLGMALFGVAPVDSIVELLVPLWPRDAAGQQALGQLWDRSVHETVRHHTQYSRSSGEGRLLHWNITLAFWTCLAHMAPFVSFNRVLTAHALASSQDQHFLSASQMAALERQALLSHLTTGPSPLRSSGPLPSKPPFGPPSTELANDFLGEVRRPEEQEGSPLGLPSVTGQRKIKRL